MFVLSRRYVIGAATIASLFIPQCVTASYLVESIEEAQQTEGHYFQAQFVPTYQHATRVDENHGNYTADLISYTPLAKQQGTVGDTTMVIWINSVGLLGGLQSVGEMRDKAGLLWDTNRLMMVIIHSTALMFTGAINRTSGFM